MPPFFKVITFCLVNRPSKTRTLILRLTLLVSTYSNVCLQGVLMEWTLLTTLVETTPVSKCFVMGDADYF